MHFSTIAGALALGASVAQAVKFHTLATTPFHAPSRDVVSPHVLNLRRSGTPSRSSRILAAARKSKHDPPVAGGPYGLAPIISAELGEEFLTDIQWNGKTFTVIIDTGSSDTWLVEKDFKCLNVSTSAPLPQSACMFGPLYTRDHQFKQIKNENFNISYGDGEFLTGVFGNEAVTLAGITVEEQQVAIVNKAAWSGDNVSSGLVGLAYPNITSAYAGDDPTKDGYTTNDIQYNPIFTNMYTQGSIPPMFSVAINRGNNTGLFAIGGLPPVDYTPGLASAPIEIVTQGSSTNQTQLSFYTITMTVSYSAPKVKGSSSKAVAKKPKSTTSAKFQSIVDTGTTLLYLETADCNAVNALFSPPAVLDPNSGAFVVGCNATAPHLTLNIGHKKFLVDPRDMILPQGDGTCISGIADAGNSLGIIGDVALKSLLAVFDVGAGQMRFGERKY
jgi:hypothetical protein